MSCSARLLSCTAAMIIADPICTIAANGVLHTAFGHHGDYYQAIKDDRAAIRAITDALAGPHSKPFVMSSATGFTGNTGPHPVTEEFVVDVEHPLAARCLPERVGLALMPCMQTIVSNLPIS